MDDEQHATELRLLGGWDLCVRGTSVPVGYRQQRLLAALAVFGRSSRHFLSGLLWPDCTDSRAMGSLRASVFTVSRRLPETVGACGHDLYLHRSVTVDLHRLLDFLAYPDSPAGDRWMIERGSVDLLPGWYDDWVVAEQERLRSLCIHAMEELAQDCLERGELYRSLKLAQRVRDLDPIRESAVRILIQGHLAMGNESEALHTYRGYWTTLAQELGARPSARVTSLLPFARHP